MTVLIASLNLTPTHYLFGQVHFLVSYGIVDTMQAL